MDYLGLLKTIWGIINLQEVNNISALLSTGISFYLLRTVRSVRRDFLFAARLPQIEQTLQDHASEINLILNVFDERVDDAKLVFERCKADLSNLSDKIAGSDKKRLKMAVKQMTKDIGFVNNCDSLSKEQARNLYVKLNGVLQELANLKEDQKWSVRDVG